MKRLFLLGGLFFSFIVPPPSRAEEVTLPSIAGDSIYFWNSAPKEIYIYVSTDEKNWTEVDIRSGKGETVSISGSPPKISLAIQTGQKVFRAQISQKNRYEVYWDDAKSYFAIRPLLPR